jgi:F-type H+-transporting ATPase subunit beta
VVLKRSITEKGIYPAIDPLESTSRILTPNIVGQEHYDVAQMVLKYLQSYNELLDIIAILGVDELSKEDQVVVARARRLEKFFSQPFFVTGQFTGLAGKYIDRTDTIESCREICQGRYDNLPEDAFMYIGAVEDAVRKAEKIARR